VYTRIDGVLVHGDQGGVERQYVGDPLGSLVGELDENQNLTYPAEYWPYGEVRSWSLSDIETLSKSRRGETFLATAVIVLLAIAALLIELRPPGVIWFIWLILLILSTVALILQALRRSALERSHIENGFKNLDVLIELSYQSINNPKAWLSNRVDFSAMALASRLETSTEISDRSQRRLDAIRRIVNARRLPERSSLVKLKILLDERKMPG